MWSTAEWRALLDGAIRVEDPLLLGSLLVGVLLLAMLSLRRGPWRVRVPAVSARRGLRVEPAWLLSVALRAAALALIAVGLSRPVGLIPENPAGGDGVDLLIALDASGSMNALDGQLEGRRVTRLDLARSVIADFVREREGDRIGLIAFGEHAVTLCPLTVDHRLVQRALDRVNVGLVGDATALGEAIGLGTRRLHVEGAPPDGRRVLLLVTDGRHNAGKLAPETAASIATLKSVKIHAVGIGGRGRVPFARTSPGEPLRFEKVDLDEATLRAVASTTGGRYFHAEKPDDLQRVAELIDRLEARPRALEPRYRKASLLPWTLALAIALLLLESATAHGLLRRLP